MVDGQLIKPCIAIIDTNMLSIIGLRQILQTAVPILDVVSFNSFESFSQSDTTCFIHFFVAQTIILEHRSFFINHLKKTMVLTTSSIVSTQIGNFNSLNINVSEEELVKNLFHLLNRGHAGGRNIPSSQSVISKEKQLSKREVEVLCLIVRGFINKEIAEQLHISLTTVITHRKNIMNKLDLKSISALTIYAVMHGYVNIDRI